MILSMTGFGRGKASAGGFDYTVEIKSVNSHFTDVTCKMPKAYLRAEDKIKQRIGEVASRGKIELFLTVETSPGAADETLALNEPYLRAYLKCLKELVDVYGLPDDVTATAVARNAEIFTRAKSADESAQELYDKLSPALEQALAEYYRMKAVEGDRLCADIDTKLDAIEEMVEKIQAKVPETVENYRTRLTERIREYLDEANIDETRIIQEVAIFTDKVAIDEEMVRLASHIASFRDILREREKPEAVPVGRKLDFLLQEINREINTTGSKCNSADVAQVVVNAKSEVEKIREQIQNLE